MSTFAATGERAWELVYQSRSGPPQVPWLEPDIVDHLGKLHAEGVRDVIVVPVGFPPNSSFTISPFGTDNVGQPGAGASVIVTVLAPGAWPARSPPIAPPRRAPCARAFGRFS